VTCSQVRPTAKEKQGNHANKRNDRPGKRRAKIDSQSLDNQLKCLMNIDARKTHVFKQLLEKIFDTVQRKWFP
jgi:DNA anti-recombination protein RmuC